MGLKRVIRKWLGVPEPLTEREKVDAALNLRKEMGEALEAMMGNKPDERGGLV